MGDRVAVVVLGYGEEPLLERCLTAARRQLTGPDQLVLVDNGIPAAVRDTASRIGARVAGDGHNLGFAGGCNLGAAATDAEILVFVNSDAVLRLGAVDALVAALADPAVGVVSGCLRLADQPDLVNSAGNPLHYLGFTWAGHCGEPADRHAEAGTVAVATGGLFAVRRTTWESLGGFDPEYFAYHEDTDLSLRCWLSGREVRFEPAAVADHDYEFTRNPRKLHLVERNRLVTVLSDYPTPLLRRILPALLLLEVPLSVLALVDGWGRQKLAATWWVVARWRWIARRRRRIQAQVAVPPSAVAALLSADIAPPMVRRPPGMGVLNALLRRYWRWVERSLP